MLLLHVGSRQISTTAYHPVANGLIERLHHQLLSHPNTIHWIDALLIVLLGIRTVDIQCSAEELVYAPYAYPVNF